MKKVGLRAGFAFVLICCLNIGLLAQSGRKPQGREPAEKPVVRLETREVVIPLSAYDADGKYVDDLAPKDVLVLEDGESRPVSDLKREPANIVLILDLSNEIGTFKNGPTQRIRREETPIWEKEKNYQVVSRPTTRLFAENFVSRLSPNDQIAIIQYSDKVQLVQDWTNDPNRAINSLNSRYRVGIKASYLDALKMAADKLQTREKGRRVIVLVSDGLDSNSKSGRSQTITALAKSRAAVFVIGWAEALKSEISFAANWIGSHEGLNSSSAKRVYELKRHLLQLEAAATELRIMAETSGGDLYLPATHDELALSPMTLVREIGAQYSLAFITERKPSLEDNRLIEVIPARKGVSLRSRRSYYVGDDAGSKQKTF